MEPERWTYHQSRTVWLRLAKLSASGLTLSAKALQRLQELSTANPSFRFEPHEREEFLHWMSGTSDPDYEDSRDVDIAPRKQRELVQWLTKPQPERRPFHEDTWRDACKKHPLNCLFALADVAAQGNWLSTRWSDALYAWGHRKQVRRLWRYAAPLLHTMPDVVLQEIAHGATSWIQSVSKSINQHEEILLNLCRRVLAMPLEAGTGMIRNGELIDRPVTEAINHPVGHITQALLNLWFKLNPNDDEHLPANIEPLFTEICDVRIARFRHGRVLLGSRLIALFRVDRTWTEHYLLPLFSWENPSEAKAVWEGFLWSPRLYQPLLIAFKPQFLESANHYADLGEHCQQFAAFITYAALGPTEGYSLDEFRSALGALPQEGLEECAQALYQALEGAANQREDYWKNRVQPFWQHVWPKSRRLATPRIANSLAKVAIAARSEFPVALAAVKDWLQPLEHPGDIARKLHRSGLCELFPSEALTLLSSVFADQDWVARELGQCLDEIVRKAPELEHDIRFQRLREFARRRGL